MPQTIQASRTTSHTKELEKNMAGKESGINTSTRSDASAKSMFDLPATAECAALVQRGRRNAGQSFRKVKGGTNASDEQKATRKSKVKKKSQSRGGTGESHSQHPASSIHELFKTEQSLRRTQTSPLQRKNYAFEAEKESLTCCC